MTLNSLINILLVLIFANTLNANNIENNSDCIILKDENSIICKYTHKRTNEEKNVQFNWIDPMGIISRQRTMIIPAGHGSVYDFRYINGRASGIWIFEVIDNNISYKTKFKIE